MSEDADNTVIATQHPQAHTMATHVQTHDGLERIVRGSEVLGQVASAERRFRRPLVARIVAALKSAATDIYRSMVAVREARALEEIDRYDWRLAAEIRAARDREFDAAGDSPRA